jgi:hypothetical protein
MDVREIDRFLRRIYTEGDDFEVLYKDEASPATVSRGVRTMPLDTGDQRSMDILIEEFGRAEAAGFNIYVSAMPMHVQEAKVYDRIWVDQDDLTAPWPFGADPAFEGTQWPMPTSLVKTSSGEGGFRWQAIWLLAEPIEPTKAKIVMKQLAKRIGADESVHDPRRVLRLPGALNVKRDSMARLMDTRSGTVTLEAFYLPVEDALTKMMNAEVRDPAHVLGEWLAGVTEGDRNRTAYVAARFLKSCGVDYGDAGAILLLGARRAEPELEAHEVEHALDSAYHRAD